MFRRIALGLIAGALIAVPAVAAAVGGPSTDRTGVTMARSTPRPAAAKTTPATVCPKGGTECWALGHKEK